MSKHIVNLYIIFTLSFLSACTGKTVFSEYRHLPNSGWEADSAVVFNITIPDTTLRYDVLFFIRHTQKYRYQNMWLFVDEQNGKEIMPNNINTQDTIEFFLADDRGRWLGNGYGNTREMPIIYKHNSVFSSDTIVFRIKQAMREETLRGISEIGLKIVEYGQE